MREEQRSPVLPFLEALNDVNTYSNNFWEDINKDLVNQVLEEEQYDNVNVSSLFNSILSPAKVSKFLIELKEDAALAFKFFNFTAKQKGFSHTLESHCIIIHVLFGARMYSQTHEALKLLILLRPSFASSDIFDTLRSTQSLLRFSGFGVFDALFSTLTELGFLEEAHECFVKMTKFGCFPKAHSCNNLLHRLSRSNCVELSRKFFEDMAAARIPFSVFTYNIMIDFMCKGNLHEALLLRDKMTDSGIELDLYAYTTIIWGLCKDGNVKEARKLLEEMTASGSCGIMLMTGLEFSPLQLELADLIVIFYFKAETRGVDELDLVLDVAVLKLRKGIKKLSTMGFCHPGSGKTQETLTDI
ncbi:hypothetical protein H6P81_015942 [Aristolochia fimbriata]|uniref:Pentatricopeptide repeat-containing protein n=1 Tax=Aristolochia fimbriata TaxID=158543 RepID=A0AAV7EA32_ARIFI|nr:hypothetical protein H6P81_015942 [Aristolochia fimbriata]